MIEDALAELIYRDPDAAPDAPSAHRLRLRAGLNTLGRAPDNSVVVNLEQVSRHHAELTLTDGRAYLKDLGSSNRTYVNDRAVTLTELRDGDAVRLGRVCFAFALRAPQSPADASARRGADAAERLGHGADRADSDAPDPPSGRTPHRPALHPTDGAANGRSDRLDPARTPHPDPHAERGPQSLLREPSATALVLRRQASEADAASRLGILLDIGRRLAAPHGPGALPAHALDLLFEALAVDRAAILLPRADGTPRIVAQRVRPGLPADPGFCNPDVVAAALSRGAPVVTTDTIHDPLRSGAALEEVTTLAVAVCAPLPSADHPPGALYLDNLALRHVHTEADVEFVGVLAGQIAVALDQARRFGLTGAPFGEGPGESPARVSGQRRPAPTSGQTSGPASGPTSGPPPAPAREPSRGRRPNAADAPPVAARTASALCCEIAGFHACCRRLRPREVFELLERYLARMVDGIVIPRQGSLERCVDATLLALWGTPQPGPGDADRAVAAAVAMQRDVRELNREWTAAGHAPIALRIGVATGRVAVGATRLRPVVAIGALPRRARRLCRTAAIDEVLLCARTLARLTPGRYRAEAVPAAAGQPTANPPPVYRLAWHDAPPDTP